HEVQSVHPGYCRISLYRRRVHLVDDPQPTRSSNHQRASQCSTRTDRGGARSLYEVYQAHPGLFAEKIKMLLFYLLPVLLIVVAIFLYRSVFRSPDAVPGGIKAVIPSVQNVHFDDLEDELSDH